MMSPDPGGCTWENVTMTDATTVDPDAIVTYRAWWPAAVLMPDKSVRHRVRVYATNAGLLVYAKPPTEVTPEFGALTPDWSSPIDFTATREPSQQRLPGQSWDIETDAGLVVITYVGGCGCGSAIKLWRPAFSARTAPWPVT